MTSHVSASSLPTDLRAPRVWHALRGWFDRVTMQSIAAALNGEPKEAESGWHPPQSFPPAPGPAEVLPALPNRSLRIECLPSSPAETLPDRVKGMCDLRAAEGLQLTSTFSHDGSIFLVFKRL